MVLPSLFRILRRKKKTDFVWELIIFEEKQILSFYTGTAIFVKSGSGVVSGSVTGSVPVPGEYAQRKTILIHPANV